MHSLQLVALHEDSVLGRLLRLLGLQPPLDHLGLWLRRVQREDVILPLLARPLHLVKLVDRLGVDVVQQPRDRRVGLRVAQVEACPRAARCAATAAGAGATSAGVVWAGVGGAGTRLTSGSAILEGEIRKIFEVCGPEEWAGRWP